MPDLLDCLMPACHQAGVITTPAVASVTFPAVIAAVALAVMILRMVCPIRSHQGAGRTGARCCFLHPGRCRARQESGVRRYRGTRASPGSRLVRQRTAEDKAPGAARS